VARSHSHVVVGSCSQVTPTRYRSADRVADSSERRRVGQAEDSRVESRNKATDVESSQFRSMVGDRHGDDDERTDKSSRGRGA
jgi:hypothetical protein